MLEAKPQKVELYGFTRRTVLGLLHSKGSVVNLKSHTQADQVEAFNLLKVFHVLKAVGFVYFLDELNLVYLGTARATIKFLRFAQEKIARSEGGSAAQQEGSEVSERGPQDYPFRPPKDFRDKIGTALEIGAWEFSAFEFKLLEDFCEQVVMEMLFDPSGLTRQVHHQGLR